MRAHMKIKLQQLFCFYLFKFIVLIQNNIVWNVINYNFRKTDIIFCTQHLPTNF